MPLGRFKLPDFSFVAKCDIQFHHRGIKNSGATGLEPIQKILEIFMLQLHHAPIKNGAPTKIRTWKRSLEGFRDIHFTIGALKT